MKFAASNPFPRHRLSPSGFTLVETMLAVLVLGLLACAATLSFSQPLASAQARETFDLLAGFDQSAREAARGSGRAVRLLIDPSAGTITRFEGTGKGDRRANARLPRGFNIDQVRIGRRHFDSTPAVVEISSSGLCRSYAFHLRGPRLDQWVVFAGLSGQMIKVADESTVDAMLGVDRSPAQDVATWSDAD
jgi:prepilin-type N-terminal cleavage/methylation domain-containing protein